MFKNFHKKYILLILAALILISFIILLSFFYYKTDNLVNYAPSNTLFYLHLDLNKFHQGGYLGDKWLKEYWPGKTMNSFLTSQSDLAIIGANFRRETISLLDEAGCFVFFENNSSQNPSLVFIFKTKPRVVDFPLVMLGNDSKTFYYKKLTPRIWAIASQSEILNNIKLNSSGFKKQIKDFSFSPELVWGRGYLNLREFADSPLFKADILGLNSETIDKIKNFKGVFLKINFIPYQNSLVLDFGNSLKPFLNSDDQEFSWEQGKKFIISSLQDDFKTNALLWGGWDLFSSDIQKFSPSLISLNQIKQESVLPDKLSFTVISSNIKAMDSLEEKIKENLALKNPVEKKVILPDKTSFIELVADPNIFHFNEKQINNLKLSYFSDDKIEIALAQDNKYAFISNNISSLEKILINYQTPSQINNDLNISNYFSSDILRKNFSPVLYWKIKQFGIDDMVIINQNQKIKGCLRLF
ncbi:MAG: hypothetical protein PHF10_00615 [Patescibacteria group bacterium]|nr:hypothetical protein [Patescibacteria group bacterium]MDD5534242.1 hypothetical protein [Patescibacteria group bacterium]